MESGGTEKPDERGSSAPFEIESSTSNLLKFYRTPTSFTSNILGPSVAVIKDKPFLMVPTSNSYSIFNLQDLTLQFLGPNFPRIDCILQSGVFVYVCCGDTVYKTYRGEISSKLTLASVISNTKEIMVKEMVVFGSYFIANCGNRLLVCECCDDSDKIDLDDTDDVFLKGLYKLDYSKRISNIFHPHTYFNKILIIFEDGSADLYNLGAKKTIFTFSFGSKITCVSQTSVADIVGLGMADGTVRIFNLKKNKLVFDIVDYRSKCIRKIDFKDSFLMVITEDAHIYDLNIKKEVHRRQYASSGLMVNNSMALVTTSSSIEIITLNDMKMLKSRQVLNQDVTSISRISETEMVLSSPSRLFKMCIYRDEINSFLKTSSSVDLVSADSNIFVSGDGRLTYIDSEGKLHSFLHMKCVFIRTFRDFCMIGRSSKILIMNLKSKRLVLKLEVGDAIDGDFGNETFTVLTKSGIYTYNYASELLYQYGFGNKGPDGNDVAGIRNIGNLYFLQRSCSIQIVSQELCREFEGTKYSIDPEVRIMATVAGSDVLLYDIISGNILDRLRTNKTLVDIVILDSLKFVGVLDSESGVHLLSNLSHFNAIRNASIVAESAVSSSMPVTKKESTFYKDLLMYKDFQSRADSDLALQGLNSSEVSELMQIIKKSIGVDFYSTQNVLNKVLTLKGKLVDPRDLEEISVIIEQKLGEFEEKVLKTIGYLNLEKNKLL